MATLLLVVGAIWAGLGALNIVGMPWTDRDLGGVVTFGLIFNMVLFVVPGLLLVGLGSHMNSRAKRAVDSPKAQAEKRIATLNALLAEGSITHDEFETRRQEILKEI